MKLAILGDTHFGMRSDNVTFHHHYKMFYENVFFPYLEDNKIKTVIQLGDLFDRRKFVNYRTLHLSKQYFFNRFSKAFNPIRMHTFPGNHDIFYRNTVEVNSIQLVLSEYITHGFIHVYSKPQTVEFDGLMVDFIPWICKDNEQQIKDFMAQSKSQVCFGHFEVQGFEMEKGHICVEGMLREDLAKYEMVISGHFHHKSSDGHIFFVGAPGEMTWADYNDSRGFHIFDTDTRELEFIENPYRIHHKIIYDDSQETLESVSNRDYSSYASTNVKVIVHRKDNPFVFDTFMDALDKVSPLDISIVEDFTDTNIADEDVIDQADDTPKLINKYIDTIETRLDKDKLKNIMREVYVDAQNFESLRELNQ